jgi:hypothetical protein
MIYYDEVALTSFDLVLLGFPFYAAAWAVCWLQTVMFRQTNIDFWYCPVFKFVLSSAWVLLPDAWFFSALIFLWLNQCHQWFCTCAIWIYRNMRPTLIFTSDVFHVGWIRMQAINFASCIFSSCLNQIPVWLLTWRSHRKWNGGLWQSTTWLRPIIHCCQWCLH